jgi:hypothetical protein
MKYAAALYLALAFLFSSAGCQRVEETPAVALERSAGPRVKCGTRTKFCMNPLPDPVVVEVTASDYCPTEDSAVILNGATRYPVADMSTLTIPLKLYKDDYLEFSANGKQTEDGHYCSVEARIVKVMP